ncbi:hypothetical protein GGR56DRAFT_663312 [Xylariaceae sp. FL0804]|nr:hypothetical protein GGR56DRAFT_663312 [Xylariaceae sp. FL0804]
MCDPLTHRGNTQNVKKRRPYEYPCEDAPAAPVAQQPSFSAPATETPSEIFSSQEFDIILTASTILRCPPSHLLNLSNRRLPSQPQSTPIPPSPLTHKRPRLNPDVAAMASREKPPPADQPPADDYERPSDVSPSLVAGGSSSLANVFTTAISTLAIYSPSLCTPCGLSGFTEPSEAPAYPYAQSHPPHEPKPLSADPTPRPLPQGQPNFYDPPGSIVSPPTLTGYPVLQPSRPITVQPNTGDRGMGYPEAVPKQVYVGPSDAQHCPPTSPENYMMGYPPYNAPPPESSMRLERQYNAPQGAMVSVPDKPQMAGQPPRLEIVDQNERPPPARRGPFKSNDIRERTAETRKIGSCIRCRMQRIRCETNPTDKNGRCLTCDRVGGSVKVWRMPCLRYKLTDVKLFKPAGQVKGYEWTTRWVEGLADNISQWASPEIRLVEVSEGYTKQRVTLSVRPFIPQDGDKLDRTWVYNGVMKTARIPAYAISSLDGVKELYDRYIEEGLQECCKSVLSKRDPLLRLTYGMAIKYMADRETNEKERELLKKALRLWMAIRLTTKSSMIVGEETLGMSRDIMDETSSLRGCIPLPPVMGAQIEQVLIEQIQSRLRRETLETLQNMMQAKNKHQTWFTTYLVTFIFLHNAALLCQHDASYARKHEIKVNGNLVRFARKDEVRQYQASANILLGYFHYGNKGVYPFTAECRDQDLETLAQMDEHKIKAIKYTRRAVQQQGK